MLSNTNKSTINTNTIKEVRTMKKLNLTAVQQGYCTFGSLLKEKQSKQRITPIVVDYDIGGLEQDQWNLIGHMVSNLAPNAKKGDGSFISMSTAAKQYNYNKYNGRAKNLRGIKFYLRNSTWFRPVKYVLITSEQYRLEYLANMADRIGHDNVYVISIDKVIDEHGITYDVNKMQKYKAFASKVGLLKDSKHTNTCIDYSNLELKMLYNIWAGPLGFPYKATYSISEDTTVFGEIVENFKYVDHTYVSEQVSKYDLDAFWELFQYIQDKDLESFIDPEYQKCDICHYYSKGQHCQFCGNTLTDTEELSFDGFKELSDETIVDHKKGEMYKSYIIK